MTKLSTSYGTVRTEDPRQPYKPKKNPTKVQPVKRKMITEKAIFIIAIITTVSVVVVAVIVYILMRGCRVPKKYGNLGRRMHRYAKVDNILKGNNT